MRTIGLIGGMSWESSLEYYRLLNEGTKRRLGQSHSCPNIMYSVDFAALEELQHAGAWGVLADEMVRIGQILERAGADLVLICSNTMHKLAPEVEKALSVPLLHIADAAAQRAKELGLGTLGLLGTQFTMEQAFYRDRLERHGLTVRIPSKEERRVVHAIIYHELIGGELNPVSRRELQTIIEGLAANGCSGVVLGCTEIPLLIQQEHSPIPVLNTTELHVQAALTRAFD